MNSYNGFDPKQRMAALKWLRAEQAAGRRAWPKTCEACGQDEGVIDSHSEDYSSPFGVNIGQFSLCFRCHMMLHCRFRNPNMFETYRSQVAGGVQFGPMCKRDFPLFKRQHLIGGGRGVDHTMFETNDFIGHADLLGQMATGRWNPNKR